jgi:hypothetical protein
VDDVMIRPALFGRLGRRGASGETDVCTADPQKDLTMRHFHTNLRLLGAGLAASIGLFTLGAAATPSFAATSSLPDVTPVVCPSGLTCPSTNPPSGGGNGTASGHDNHDKKAPKNHKPAPPKPSDKASLNSYTDSTNTGSTGVKWH